MSLATGPPVGRLAPSPTGGLHLGHARTFLAAWLQARAEHGRVILRIEDLDVTRVRPEAAALVLDDLRWLGLTWDEGPDVGGPSAPYVQSLRLDRYQDALQRLAERDRIYPCTCTRAEVARAASAPHAEDEGPTYPGTCSGRSARDADRLVGRPFAWRFRVPAGAVDWDDLVQGPRALDPSSVGGDFIVARPSVGPAYQLAVVVDDAAMGVTQVVRGDDLVPSTPRQVLLYRALGLPIPRFGHLPLVIGPDGRRLAKRDGSIKLAALRSAGVDPADLIGWLARSLDLSSPRALGGPECWVDRFETLATNRQPWTLTVEALESLGRGCVPGWPGGDVRRS